MSPRAASNSLSPLPSSPRRADNIFTPLVSSVKLEDLYWDKGIESMNKELSKNSMNKDEGAHKLNNIYDELILKWQTGNGEVVSSTNKLDSCAVQSRVNKVP